MLLKPLALIASKVDGTTGGLFQDPSVGVASSVLPKFHPGLRRANASVADMGLNSEFGQRARSKGAAALRPNNKAVMPKLSILNMGKI